MPSKSVKVKKDFWFYLGQSLAIAFICSLAAIVGVAMAYIVKQFLALV